MFDFEAFGGFGKEVRSTLREAANQLSNKLSHAQHLDEVTWTTKNWHGLQMQRLSVVLHTAVAWQTVNELACGESGIVHGAKCIAVLNGSRLGGSGLISTPALQTASIYTTICAPTSQEPEPSDGG